MADYAPASTALPPPLSSDSREAKRIEHTRLRRRITDGEHEADVRLRIRRSVGSPRGAAWGDPDMTSNPAESSATALATLYDPVEDAYDPLTDTVGSLDGSPFLSNADEPDSVSAMAAAMHLSGIWPQMQRTQRDTLALREMLVRIDGVKDPDGKVHLDYRPVYPDMVYAVPDPLCPSRPIEIREWFPRDGPGGTTIWTQEVWSLRNGGSMRILDEGGRDVSDRYNLPKGGMAGADYPRDATGKPVLPYVIYHAARTGYLWDYKTGQELFDGTLQVCLLLSLYQHHVRNASWPQRYMLGASLKGGELVGDGTDAARQVVDADAAIIAELEKDANYEGQPLVGQWAPSSDPGALLDSILAYERRLYSRAGMDPSDVQRISGDPRSGYALEISRKGKDQAALRYHPVFALSDTELVTKSAILWNLAAGIPGAMPETGWGVEHAPIRAIRLRMAKDAKKGMQPASVGAPSLLAGAQALAASVAAGQLPRETAVQQLAWSYGIAVEVASALLGPVGTSFRIDPTLGPTGRY